MKILSVRNPHDALARAIPLLRDFGWKRDSRNGPVLQAPWPVTTVYSHPCERVIFWPERDANPFFHLYESLWMLAGRNDVAGVARYAKNMANYSDDGNTFHAAYGYRWRKHFGVDRVEDSGIGEYTEWISIDQLSVIAEALTRNPDDRRNVLQMWSPVSDLAHPGKDLPCNLTATFQRDPSGALHLVVFCRSNDIIWGAYGANAVHFSMLLEYMALWIGCPVGTMTQVSVNWHAYLDVFEKIQHLRPDVANFVPNPYLDPHAVTRAVFEPMGPDIVIVNREISRLLSAADSGLMNSSAETRPTRQFCPWAYNAHIVLEAHEVWRVHSTSPERYNFALEILRDGDETNDWVMAATDWMIRRREARHGNTLEA
jgi:thymidylate synthase